MEVGEREKDEAVAMATRAKAKAGTESATGHTGHASKSKCLF